jgi:hypothetical protein
MIYLATPYSADREVNYLNAMDAAVYLFKQGKPVFSPILHWHDASKLHVMPTDASYWWEYNKKMLSYSTKLCIGMFPGWRTSVGVQQEIAEAVSQRLTISYFTPDMLDG